MTKLLAIGNYGASERGFMFEGSGFMLMVGMFVLSISIMSLLIFSCADDGSDNPRKRRDGDGGGGGGGGCGDGGEGDGGGGGGGCGGGGGGGGC
ncbi:hypothetical protein ACP275_13G056700 [Erythranthe tilingii]